jgi:hypothetical protein
MNLFLANKGERRLKCGFHVKQGSDLLFAQVKVCLAIYSIIDD